MKKISGHTEQQPKMAKSKDNNKTIKKLLPKRLRRLRELEQCDQITRDYFINFWLFITAKICPITKDIANDGLKFCQ